MSAVNRLIPKNPRKIVFYSNMGFRDNVKAVYDYLISQDCSEYSIVCAVNDWEDFAKRPHPDNVQFVSPTGGVKHFFTGKYFFYSFGKYPVKPSKKQVVVNLWHGSPLKRSAIIWMIKMRISLPMCWRLRNFLLPLCRRRSGAVPNR